MSSAPNTTDQDTVTSQPQRKKPWARRYLGVSTIVAVALVSYILFLGENSLPQRMEYQHQIDSLTVCLKQEQDSLEYYRDLNLRLSTDPQLMEQVVREQYNMNRPNEDVYVIEYD